MQIWCCWLIHLQFGVADFLGTGGGDPPSVGSGGIGWKEKE